MRIARRKVMDAIQRSLKNEVKSPTVMKPVEMIHNVTEITDQISSSIVHPKIEMRA